MFGSNLFGAPYFAQGPVIIQFPFLRLFKSFTRAITGFNRTTRREF